MVLFADSRLDAVPAPDIVLVPGGPGTRKAVEDAAAIEWLRLAHQNSRWTTSVCTGSLVLGAAGILAGKQAPSHWIVRDRLHDLGAEPVSERVVADAVIAAAGGSSGIDMALTLAAREADEETARMLQLAIEYDPHPPFDSGSFEKADAETRERATRYFVPAPYA